MQPNTEYSLRSSFLLPADPAALSSEVPYHSTPWKQTDTFQCYVGDIDQQLQILNWHSVSRYFNFMDTETMVKVSGNHLKNKTYNAIKMTRVEYDLLFDSPKFRSHSLISLLCAFQFLL